MNLWVGTDLMLPLITVIIITIYFYLWKFREALNIYKDATGNWQVDFWRPYIVSVLNIILDFVLIKWIGINGVLIATIVSFPLFSLPWEIAVMFKYVFKKNPFIYCVKMLLYTLVIIGTGVLTYFICSLLPSTGMLNFILKCLICVVLPNLVFLISSFNLEEFKYAKSKVLFLAKKIFHNNDIACPK